MLKPLEDLLKSDPRHEYFQRINLETGHITRRSLDDHYQDIAAVEIGVAVPEDVRVQFDKARNVLVYSWFVYEFSALAEQHAFVTVEMALRTKLEIEDGKDLKRSPGLKKLLDRAIERKWLRDDGFSAPRRNCEDWRPYSSTSEQSEKPLPEVREYCRVLSDSLPWLRNSLVHGTSDLNTPGGALFTLTICSELINQLFP